MSEENWKHKYHKYKMKYMIAVNKIKQIGGLLQFIKSDNGYQVNIIKNHLYPTDTLFEEPIYNPILSVEQKTSIGFFTSNILPFVQLNEKYIGQYIDMTLVKHTNMYRILAYCGLLGIHIIPLNPILNDVISINEINLFIHIKKFYSRSGKDLWHENIIKYFGYVSPYLQLKHNQLQNIKKGVYSTDLIPSSNDIVLSGDIYSEINKVSLDIEHIQEHHEFDIPSNIVYILTEHPFARAVEYTLEQNMNVGRLHVMEKKRKVHILSLFIKHIFKGIKFLHEMEYQHNNICLENIGVFGTSDKPIFKICEFYNTMPFIRGDKQNINLSNGTLVPSYDQEGIFETAKSPLYDWHCMYIDILRLLESVSIEQKINNTLVYTKHENLPNSGIEGLPINSTRSFHIYSIDKIIKTTETPEQNVPRKIYEVSIDEYLKNLVVDRTHTSKLFNTVKMLSNALSLEHFMTDVEPESEQYRKGLVLSDTNSTLHTINDYERVLMKDVNNL